MANTWTDLPPLRISAPAGAPSRPRLTEVEAFLQDTWSNPTARRRAEETYRAWALLATAGAADSAESCISAVWALRRADRCAGMLAACKTQGIPLERLTIAEPSETAAGVYYLAWRNPWPNWRRRLRAKLGLIADATLESGRFRKHPFGHPDTKRLTMRLPAEAAHWAFLLARLPEPEEIAVFALVNEPDPILAVMANDQWFMVCTCTAIPLWRPVICNELAQAIMRGRSVGDP
ncbi:MAG: hypothetical protein NTZ05_21440 [Chloroflexi bacterium]|nr:hypothetical protein [Chloroflexota bacterium]